MKIDIYKIILLFGVLSNALFAIDFNITPPTLETTEDGSTITFQVGLNSYPAPPDENVTIYCYSDNPSEGVCSGTSAFTFLPAYGAIQLPFSLTGVSDGVVDGNVSYNVTFTTQRASNDSDELPVFDPQNSVSYTVVNIDNGDDSNTVTPPSPTGKVIVSRTSGRTSEEGGYFTFSLMLEQAPTEDVVIDINSTDSTEGDVSLSSLTFTSSNWDEPQRVTVSGVDDSDADGEVEYAIALNVIASLDGYYNGYDPADITVINSDDEIATTVVPPNLLLINPLGSSQTTEAGGSAQYGFSLSSQPAGNITVSEQMFSFGVDAIDATEFVFSDMSFLFTPDNWNIEQNLTVTGVDDLDNDGDISQNLTFVDTAGIYSSGSLTVTNIDDEAPAATFSVVGNSDESGSEATITVTLHRAPISDVIYFFESLDLSEGNVTSASLTFTASDWETPQTVGVRGVDDAMVDFNRTYLIKVSNTSADPNFFLPIMDVYTSERYSLLTLVNEDNEDHDSLVSINQVNPYSSEIGNRATFTMVLNHQPEVAIRIYLESNNTNEGVVVSPVSKFLTFTPDNWNTPQNVIVAGVDDGVLDGVVAYQINFNVVSRFDVIVNVPPISLYNRDLSFSIIEDDPYSSIMFEATDIENNPLMYQVSASNDKVSVSISSNELFITPVAHANGSVNLDIVVTKATDASFRNDYSFTVTIDPVNDIPTITIDSTLITNEDNGQSLMFSLTDVEDTSLTLAIDANATNGVVILSGTNVTYTPNDNYNGSDAFTISTTDSNGAKISKTVTVTVASVNDIPTITIDSTLIVQEDGSASLTFVVEDIDGDSVVPTITAEPSYGSIVIDGTNITYTPTLNYNGDDSFTVEFSDGLGGIVTKTINVTATSVNDEPSISIGNTILVNEDGSSSITFTYSDIDGDVVTASLHTNPAHGVVVINGLDITYAPNVGYSGNDAFSIALTDSNGYLVVKNVDVNVIHKVIDVEVSEPNTNVITSQTTVTNDNNSTTTETAFEDSSAQVTSVEVTVPSSTEKIVSENNATLYIVQATPTNNNLSIKAITIVNEDAVVENILIITNENNQTTETVVQTNRSNVQSIILEDASIQTTSVFESDSNVTSTSKVTLNTDGSTLIESMFTDQNGTNSSLRLETNLLGIQTQLKDDGSTKLTSAEIVSDNDTTTEVTVEITADGVVKPVMIVTGADGTQTVTPLVELKVSSEDLLDIIILKEEDGSVSINITVLIPDSGIRREN